MYLKEIGQIPLLNPKQEPVIAKAIQDGEDARAKLAAEPDLSDEEKKELNRISVEGEQAKQLLISSNPSGGLHCQKICRTRHALSGSDPGGQLRSDQGSGKV